MMQKDGNQKNMSPTTFLSIYFINMKIPIQRDSTRLIIHKSKLSKTQNVNFILIVSKPFLTSVGKGFCLQYNMYDKKDILNDKLLLQGPHIVNTNVV